MNRKLILLFLLALYSSCKSDVIVPAEINLKEVKSFYLGVYTVNVYQIQNEKIPTLKELAGFPDYKDYFDDDFKKSEWNLIDYKSEILGSFLFFLNSSKGVSSKNNVVWINTLIEDFKIHKENYYIAGFYKPLLINQVDYKSKYYFYYVLDKKNQQVISFTEKPGPF